MKVKDFFKWADKEFEVAFAQMQSESQEKQKNKEEYLKKFDAKLREFEKDYEIGDLKYNDKQMLNSLIEGLLSLEDLEEQQGHSSPVVDTYWIKFVEHQVQLLKQLPLQPAQ